MALTAKKVYAILKRQISDMEAKLNSPVRYRGTVATADLLPLNPDIGDMYNIESKSVYGEAGMNVAWNGVVWDTMGAPIDMSLYIKSSELADWVKQQNKPTYTAEEVGALPADTKIPSKTSDLQNDSGFLTKIPDNYLSGTDKTLNVSGKAADAKATGDKITELSADISNKLNKNQGSENSGKIAGINESGDIVPMFPVSVDYNEETNCLEFGSDQKMELNKGINLDSTLTKTGYAADAGAVGEITNSLKEDISNKITKFYASNQGETHITDSDNGKTQDMMIYGRSSQSTTTSKNLLKYPYITADGMSQGIIFTDNKDGSISVSGTATGVTYYNLYSNIDGKRLTLASGTYKLVVKGRSKCDVIASNSISTATNEGTFTITDGHNEIYCYITVQEGLTVDETIYPMIQLASITDESYEPYTGGIPSPSPDYPQEIKSVVNPTVKVTNEDGLKVQSVTLNNITLNAIPVSSGGNVTIDGQQYIADYVDVEHGKVIRNILKWRLGDLKSGFNNTVWHMNISKLGIDGSKIGLSNMFKIQNNSYNGVTTSELYIAHDGKAAALNMRGMTDEEFKKWLREKNPEVYNVLTVAEEIPITPEEALAFKQLMTYYPVTNISVNSEQLDGHTVFNYPISMANGWNYVKQQLNDNRDYIYDMDLQSAEAYVNSEYAVALTELEV